MSSCEFCEIFKNTFFHRTSPVAASGYDSKKYSEALIGGVLQKKVSFKTSQNLQEIFQRLDHITFFAITCHHFPSENLRDSNMCFGLRFLLLGDFNLCGNFTFMLLHSEKFFIMLLDSDLDRNVTQRYGNLSCGVCYHSTELPSLYLLLVCYHETKIEIFLHQCVNAVSQLANIYFFKISNIKYWRIYYILWKYSTSLCSVSIVAFEQVNVSWAASKVV